VAFFLDNELGKNACLIFGSVHFIFVSVSVDLSSTDCCNTLWH